MIAELMAPIDTPVTQVRLNAGLVQGLIDARLIRAQRTPALQDQRDAIASFRTRNASWACRLKGFEAGAHFPRAQVRPIK